jgi:hypothetical protein
MFQVLGAILAVIDFGMGLKEAIGSLAQTSLTAIVIVEQWNSQWLANEAERGPGFSCSSVEFA